MKRSFIKKWRYQVITYKANNGRIIEPEKQLEIEGEYDVIVAGGGIAGVGAAIASARRGCKTIVIERESMLGGLVTAGLVNIPLDFVAGIGQEMFDRLKDVDGLWFRNSDPEKHKLILDRMVKESGCDILLVSHIVDAIVENGAIRGVVTESKGGRKVILGKRVIDCSGDADAAYFAGCECMQGRVEDGIAQACSLEFRLGGVNFDKYNNSEIKRTDSKWTKLIESMKDKGWGKVAEIENHLNWLTHLPGRPEHGNQDEVSICFAHSRHCKPLDNRDLTRMYLEGREQADTLWRFIRDNVPGFESSWLIDTGSLLGVRESRRVLGEYVITTNDIASQTHFDDVICISGHGYDVHNPDGVGNIKWDKMEVDGEIRYVICSPGGYGTSWLPPGGKEALSDYWGRKGKDIVMKGRMYYDIPYRCLVPVKVENILVGGRCLSADFAAQSGCRLIMACMNMGEAAGIATALSLKKNIAPRKVDRIELQQEMLAAKMDIGQRFRVIPGVTTETEGKHTSGHNTPA